MRPSARQAAADVAAGGPIPARFTLKQRELVSQLQTQQRQLKIMADQEVALRNLTAEKARLATMDATLSARERELSLQIANQRRVINETTAALERNAMALRHLNEQQRLAKWDRVAAGSRVATDLGRSIQIAGGATGVALGIMAHANAQFAQSATLAATQVGNTVAETQRASRQIQTGILRTMGQFTASAQEMTTSAYDIYSSLTFVGNQAKQTATGLNFLKLANQAAVAGMTPLEDVTHAAVTVFNDFGKTTRFTGQSMNDMRQMMNRAFAAVRFGRMTFQEFVQSLATTAPAAKAANQTFDTMSGTMAFLTRRIPNVRMAGTSFARLLETFQRPEFIAGLKTFGVNITDAHNRMKPLPDIIDAIVKRFPALARGTKNPLEFFKQITAAGGAGGSRGLTGTIQARRAFTFLTRDVQGYRDLLGQTINDNNEFTKSLAAMRDTPGVRWQMFVRSMQALALQIGAAVTPVLLRMLEPLRQAVEWFNRLPPARRNEIAKWIAYAAGIGLVAGTFLTLIGALGRATATWMGMSRVTRMLMIGPVGLIAMAAIVISTGHGFDVLGEAVNFATDSWKGFLVTAGLVVAMLLRTRNAIVAVQAAGGLSGLAGAGGIAGSLRGAGRSASLMNTAFRVERMTALENGAKGFAASMAGAGAAMSVMPPTLAIIAGGIAATAAGAFLWKKHMDDVEKHTQRVENYMNNIKTLTDQTSQNAQRFGGLALDVRNIIRSRDAVASVRDEIKQLNQQLRTAAPGDRPGILRQRRAAYADLADAIENLRKANYRAQSSFRALTAGFRNQGATLQAIGLQSTRLNTVRKYVRLASTDFTTLTDSQRKWLLAMDDTQGLHGLNEAEDTLKNLQAGIAQLTTGANRNARELQQNFFKVIRQLADQRLIPQVNRNLQRQLFGTAANLGRMLTLPEIRLIVKAQHDRAALRQLPIQVRRALNRARYQIRVDIRERELNQKIARASGRALRNLTGTAAVAAGIPFHPDPAAARNVARGAQVFQRTITRMVRSSGISKDAAQIGADISAGVARGIENNAYLINTAIANSMTFSVRVARTAIGAQSPATKLMPVGADYVKGLEVGIKSRFPFLRDLAQNLTLQLIPETKQGVGVTLQMLQQNINQQLTTFQHFNQGLAILHARNVPGKLLNQLAQLGAEGTPAITALATASDKQLKRYVAAWQKAMAQVGDASKSGEQKAAENAQRLQQNMKEAVDNMTQIFEELRQSNEQAMGELFQGPHITGEAVQAKLDWGEKLNTKDLMIDLRQQVAAFERWQRQLARLGRRGIPAGLLASLQALGPGATQQLMLLNRMTPKQLARYVAIWRRGQADIDKATKVDFNRKLMEWRRYGRNAALRMMRGMNDESSVIRKQMERLWLSWLHGQTGAQLGNNPRHRRRGDGSKTTNNYNDTTHIHTQPGETVGTALARDRFRKKHRHRRRR